MRKQYHLRKSPRGLLAWDVDRLIALTRGLPAEEILLGAIHELDQPFWFGGETQAVTCRMVANHAKLISEADLRYPIILGADGRVMDGMHRVAGAYIEGRDTILAVRMKIEPEPDFVGVDEDSLPYPEQA